jgi:hypothetical protein
MLPCTRGGLLSTSSTLRKKIIRKDSGKCRRRNEGETFIILKQEEETQLIGEEPAGK